MTDYRTLVRKCIYANESDVLQPLIDYATLSNSQKRTIDRQATEFVSLVRKSHENSNSMDALMAEYDLSTQEGITLMCLAESLLRIPDVRTQDALIQDKIGGQAWQDHMGNSPSMFVNASTWGLMLTGKLLKNPQKDLRTTAPQTLKSLARRLGDPVIRQCIRQGMHMMGRQFVIGETIQKAYKKADKNAQFGYNHSFDMLGEAARTDADAMGYFKAYKQALQVVGKTHRNTDVIRSDGISVKLSALHPRYTYTHQSVVLEVLYPRLLQLCQLAAQYNISLCIDAEECERLDISMTLVEKLVAEPSLDDWQGLGLAVQAYQKRAFVYIDWLADIAKTHNKRLMVRLVKGAYWDTEIKRSHTLNTADFPVFTRKQHTDVSYIACVKKILSYTDCIYPCFASHNAHTIATVLTLAKDKHFEFQCLHGMGGALQQALLQQGHSVRVYAPVGGYKSLLAYLVRRLLENGANSNFVNRIANAHIPIADIIADPVDSTLKHNATPHPAIAHPNFVCGHNRICAKGIDITDVQQVVPLLENIQNITAAITTTPHTVSSLIGGQDIFGDRTSDNIAPNTGAVIGTVKLADTAHIETAMQTASDAFTTWHKTPLNARADMLLQASDILEQHTEQMLALLQIEAGKTLNDAIAEIREAVDFLRYYAVQGQNTLSPQSLPGPTGEDNTLYTSGRGVFVCISPWNFPLAIFLGQIAAALVTGNTVVAKPADSTPRIARQAVEILQQAGIPADALNLILTDGAQLGKVACPHPNLGGVCFTGSTKVAQVIATQLATRTHGIVTFIAETGGQNALIADSSALPEQVCDDVIMGAFQSAGQRCSALRVLYIQNDVADEVLDMIIGAMQALHIGDSTHLSTDVGPIISQTALDSLNAHKQWLQKNAQVLHACPMPDGLTGTFCPPMLAEIPHISVLKSENFGPILHVIRYKASDIDSVIEAINATGYGLTLGIHSRIDTTIDKIAENAKVGNIYINRNQIGAVVGTQPFGGMGLSGTGPKAGGPFYLYRFISEKTLSNNISAAGGNAHLMREV